MSSPLADAPLYLAYAVIGTGSAGLAKASLHAVHRRDWVPALWRFAAAGVLLCCNFALLVVLLRREDLSVMAPAAIGANLLTGALIALFGFKERVDARIVAGMTLIAAGVALVFLG